MADSVSGVDRFLYAVARVGLEQVLCDGCVSGRVPNEVAGVASVERELAQRVAEEDGGAAETYRGTLMVTGVRYAFEVVLFADGDGAYFVANLPPVDWSAGMRVA